MEENKIDINSLIGFFLMGLIFMGWLYLNPPPTDNENIKSENPVVSDTISTEERFKNAAETKTENPNTNFSISDNLEITTGSNNLEKITFVGNADTENIDKGKALAYAVHFSRDLGNHPANILTPEYMASLAVELSDKCDIMTSNIIDVKDFVEMGFGLRLLSFVKLFLRIGGAFWAWGSGLDGASAQASLHLRHRIDLRPVTRS